MSLLGLELSDAGIMVASMPHGQLLELEGAHRESPGFIVAEPSRLRAGKTAERQAHRQPGAVANAFWDQLNTEPVRQAGLEGLNNSELAHGHLQSIWEAVRPYGDDMVMAVPEFFTREQLGLLLGIAQELAIPVSGLAALSVAASTSPCPRDLLVHLDMHLHRSVVTVLEQGERLVARQTESLPGQGLDRLYAEWVKAIADEFVRRTRFDPFYQAASEQELYDRLPEVFAALHASPAVGFEIKAELQTHRIDLRRDLLLQKGAPVFLEICRLVESMREKHGQPGQILRLQVSHRAARLPGLTETLARIPHVRPIELPPGAGAAGVLRLRDQFAGPRNHRGVSFLTSRPWRPAPDAAPAPRVRSDIRPTHVLYRSLAYPISDQPLVVGRDDAAGVPIDGRAQAVSRNHCTIQLRGRDVLLVAESAHGTYVDEIRVAQTAVLRLGQVIRVGTPGETLQLIACVDRAQSAIAAPTMKKQAKT
ncbi:MAG: FHA domain-containing protein [Desulfobacterales bacterium]|nr:MAG: FHA domain-containing protein [Desulfobacterales bacterium]